MLKKPKKRKTRKSNLIGVLDFETDPFKYGRTPAPFCAGFYSLETGFVYFWGDDCIDALVFFIECLDDDYIIYAHNGGKFDFHFMLDFVDNPLKIIGSRIVCVKIGKHELRDSYAIIPIPLSQYIKDSIEYWKLERECRDKYRDEIVSYLRTDCLSLFDIVSKFIERFGIRLTIGGTAIKILREMHDFQSTRKTHDDIYRPYYFGGRVEAFKTGIHSGDFKVFDVNSMYPHVMKNMRHPTGSKYEIGYRRNIDKRGRIAGFADAPFYFAKIWCKQHGAFPIREKNKPLNFDIPEGEFYVTSHELKAAIETNRVSDIRVLEVRVPKETISFGDYVDKYMLEKIAAKNNKDKAGEIFAKLLLNSAYGKFGQNPEHYYDYYLGEPDDTSDFEIYSADIDSIDIWRKQSARQAYYDVATASSITGAARSVLMRALSKASNPLYCDTDSIICDSLELPKSDSELGAWKLEASGNAIALVGKKMYALRSNSDYVKVASKGVILTGDEIFGLCQGKSKNWNNQAPSFSLGKNRVRFVHREIQSLK
jgi:hypothetical protein